MKKFTLVFASLLLVVPPTTLWAGSPRGVVYDFSGTGLSLPSPCAADGTNCSGDIITCAVDETLLINTGRYSFFEGICDDSEAGQECDGELTFLEEDCATVVRIDGLMLSVSFLGNARACYADPPVDCRGALPPQVVVAEATTRGQFRQVLSTTPGFETPVQITGEGTFTKTRPFIINDKQVKMKLRTVVGTSTAQPDTGGDSCATVNGAPGCGFAGSVFGAEGGGQK